jgi:hypothetical protein
MLCLEFHDGNIDLCHLVIIPYKYLLLRNILLHTVHRQMCMW